MKQNSMRLGIVTGALLACGALQSSAQNKNTDPGGYLGVGAGISIPGDVETEINNLSGDLELDPGLRVSVAGGYRFSPLIAAELESGFIYNEVDGSDDVALSHVPILANIIFRFDTDSPFVPFIGGGAGGVLSALDFDNDDIDEDESDTDFVFAWQGLAGVHYQFSDNMSAGITYKYFGVNSPEFEVGPLNVDMDIIHNHSILGSFNWAF